MRLHRRATVLLLAGVLVSIGLSPGAQVATTEAELDAASNGRTIALGSVNSGRISVVPMETYVARVIAGEAEPNAPDAARQAIAIAIRTFAIVNLRRHGRDGYDLCDGTHCQVPRASTAATRQAALATGGRILVHEGVPAQVFYSANCGGQSETASEVWPAANYPYLRSVPDDVHDEDVPWTIDLTLEQIREALVATGLRGERVKSIEIDSRNASGRVSRLRLIGMRPEMVAGDAFRMAMGARTFRSTAFTMDVNGDLVRFTGRGYGHGVGMCVVGAARRARRGENADAILQAYFPGLRTVLLDEMTATAATPAASGAATGN